MQSTSDQTLSKEEPEEKYVVKRDGTKQTLDLQKIKNRFINKAYGLNLTYINFDVLLKKVSDGIYTGKFYHSLNIFAT
jgi:hypothetical protein